MTPGLTEQTKGQVTNLGATGVMARIGMSGRGSSFAGHPTPPSQHSLIPQKQPPDAVPSPKTVDLTEYKRSVARHFPAGSEFRNLVLSERDTISQTDWIAILPLLDRVMMRELSSR